MNTVITNPHGRLLMPAGDATEPPTVLESVAVAPAYAWGIQCANCLGWFARPRIADEDMNVCSICRHGVRLGVLAVVPDDIELVQSSVAVRERHWWHSSGSEHIDPSRAQLMHWGSREAAIERASVRLSSRVSHVGPVFLHRARLQPKSSIHPDVLLEQPGEPTDHAYGESLMSNHDVIRYINGTEGPGAVSLMLLPSTLASIACEGELVRHQRPNITR